ncbi:MAG: hypothetical protein ACRDJH_23365 [Thermomicrobiales bacterium]
MPSLRGAPLKGMGAIGTVRSFANVLRELSFDEIRDEALRTPRLLILTPDEKSAADLARGLTGVEFPSGVVLHPIGEHVADLEGNDAIVVDDPSSLGAARRVRERLPGASRTAIVELAASDSGSPEQLARIREAIVSRNLDRVPAVGRAYPAFREAAVKALIDEAAIANAQFALVSNIPAVIPIVGSLAAAGADFLVLTKNQLMLIYKIAAVHGRDLSDQFAVMREMAPVVGAGLLWRTVARETASFFPFLAGTVPKVIIAFTGTVAAGRGMDFYYRHGRKPSREQMRKYYEQAVETARNLPVLRAGKNGRKPDD